MSTLQRQLYVGVEDDDFKTSSDYEVTPNLKSYNPTGKNNSVQINPNSVKTLQPKKNDDNVKKKKADELMKDDPEDIMMIEEKEEKTILVEDLSSVLSSILESMQTDESQDEFLTSIEPFDGVDVDITTLIGFEKAKKQPKKSKKSTKKRVRKPVPTINNKKNTNTNNVPRKRIVSRNDDERLTKEQLEDLSKDMTLVKIDAAHSSIGKTSRKFEIRGGFDPWFSAKDPILTSIGKKGGIYIKQDIPRYGYNSWDEAIKDQSQEWKWEIWLDPSAAATIIHPPRAYEVEKMKIIDKCPTKMDLSKEFGKDIEFIYMSPPWKTKLHGNGVEGYFTIEHLKSLDFSKVQSRGFVFAWILWADIVQIINIFDQKGYDFSDSSSAMLSTWQNGIETKQRVPGGTHPKEKMSGTVVHGVLFKRRSKESFRIGNQIICDCFFYKAKTDRETGQHLMDHGYVYQMYQYLIVNKYKKNKLQALHLWCRPNLNRKNWAGVHSPKQ